MALTIQGDVAIGYRLVVLDRVSVLGTISLYGKSNGASLLMVNSDGYASSGYGIINNFGSVTVRDSSITARTPIAPTYSGGVSIATSMMSTATITDVPLGPMTTSCTDSFIRPGYWSGQTFTPTGTFRSTTARCA